MRSMSVTVPLLISAALPQVQPPSSPALPPAITVTTTRPRVDVATAFKLVGSATGGLWEFGDGTAPQSGGGTMSHVYRSADTFTVKVTAGRSTFHQTVTVLEPRRIVSTPSVLVPGKAAVFSLEEALGSSLVWTFGEGERPVSGGASLSHTFPREGTYAVTVRDAAETPREFKLTVPVGQQGPGAPFSISYLALRWEDGTTERTVLQAEKGLVAYADLKFEGTGQLQAEWLVDGQSLRAESQQLGFAKLATLQSGRALPAATQATASSPLGNHTLATTIPGEFQIDLPTHVAGEHRLTLKVLQPRLAFPVPVLRYFVKLAGEAQGPVIQSISPASATPGQEVDLLLTGSGFTEDMALNLGKDVAALDKPQILSPGKALVKVFVSRSALPGTRTLQARKAGGFPSAPAKLEILLAGTAPTGTTTQLDALKVTTSAKTGDQTKAPLSAFASVPAGFRSPSVDLARTPRLSHAASRFVAVNGGNGFGAIVDVGARQRHEKVPTCSAGQRLDLTKVALATPYYYLIDGNTSTENKIDNLPILRDTTQFTWQENNPGTSEYFELQFYNARSGSFLKAVKIPGNSHSYDVSPAFVQELTRLYANSTDYTKGSLTMASRTGTPTDKLASGPVASVQGSTATTQTTGHGTKSMTKLSGALAVKNSVDTTLQSSPALQAQTNLNIGTTGNAIGKTTPNMAAFTGAAPKAEPDLVIPVPMQQKASVVWRVLGFRNYPCLIPGSAGDEKPSAPTPAAPAGKALTPERKATATLPGVPVQSPGKPEPRRANASSLASSPAPDSTKSMDTSLTQAGRAGAQAPLYTTVANEVSRSEVWPLRMPLAPQGLSPTGCTISQNDPKVTLEPNKSGTSGGGMFRMAAPAFAAGTGAGSKPAHSLDENTYVFDEVWLHGTFDLSAKNVPYRLIPSSVLPKGTSPAGALGAAIQSTVDAIQDAGNAIDNSLSFGSQGSGSSGKTSGGQPLPIFNTAGMVTFKNVFVDWGDGTVEPFHGAPMGSVNAPSNGDYAGTEFYSTYKVDPGTFKHTYTHGAIDPPYRVTVFVLSEEDMGQTASVGGVVQALTPALTTKGVFTRLSGLAMSTPEHLAGSAANTSGMSMQRALAPASQQGRRTVLTNVTGSALLAGSPSANQALGRAYVVYCHDLRVVPHDDPCYLAPLNLVAVKFDLPSSEAPSALAPGTKAKVDRSGTFPSKPVDTKPLANLSGASEPKASDSKLDVNISGNYATKPFQQEASGKQGTLQRSNSSVRQGASLHMTNAGPAAQEGPNPPSTTPCNLFYSAATTVSYFGHGTVRVIWMVDGHQVGSRDVPVQSPKRTGLTAGECQTCPTPTPALALGEFVLNSPALPVDSLGRHQVSVVAEVLPDKSGDPDLIALTAELQGINTISTASPHPGSATARRMGPALSPRTMHTLSAVFGHAGAGNSKVHLGLLNPSQAPGQPAYMSFGQVAGMADTQKAWSGLFEPPYQVTAEGIYEVKEAQQGQKCNLFFPTKGGTFPITNMGSSLKLTPDDALSRASGKGLLVFYVKAGTAPDTVASYPLDLSFSNWKVDDTTVVQGQIDLTPRQPYNGPGVCGSLLEVHGSITDKTKLQDMRLQMRLSPTDTSIVTGDGTVHPEWVAEAPITTHGDWIATKGLDGQPLQLKTSKLGPTPWFFSAEGVTIDLSGIEGTDPNGGSSPEWVGVKLGTVTVVPATLGIQGGAWSKPLLQPKNWTIEGLGVKGKLDTGAWQTDYRNGHLAIANIHFEGTTNGHYSAYYKGVEISSPWFKDPIIGDASWFQQDSGAYALNLDKIHANQRPTLAGGPLSLDPLDLQFVQIKQGGLLLQGRAHLALKAEDKPLATFDVDGMGFGLDGLLYFGDGQRTTTVTLNTSSTLGLTPADLQTVALTGGNAQDTPLDLLVNGKLRLSSNPVIPGTPVAMHYSLKSSGSAGAFTAPDVKVDPFSLDVAFPMGSPSMKAKIATNYQPGSTAGGAPALPSNRFNGSVVLSLFGGAPVSAQFVLGYDQGKDYFATRVDVPLGPKGVVIYPEFVSLYRLSGGFAYNFGPEAFTDGGSITNAQPDFKGVTQLMAGARLGSADGFIYTLDGQLVIGSSGSARLDLGAWLLASNPPGHAPDAPLRGYLEYANGNFDGQIWGGYHFLNDSVSLDLGSSAAPACSLHFGSGSWHVYAGDRDGSRIAGKLFGNSTEAYLMLGNDVGMAVGGRQNWYFGGGVGVSAYVKGWMDMGLQILPQPKIIGDFSAGMEAGACVSHVGCVSASVDAHIHAEALPVSVSADCCLDLPFPFGDLCFSVKL